MQHRCTSTLRKIPVQQPQKTDESYWLVWCVDGGAPTFKHTTFESADAEAKRLARMHHGAQFVVLETVRAHQVCALVTTDLRVDRGLPF